MAEQLSQIPYETARAQIACDEAAFTAQTDAVAAAVLARPSLRFITLSGPTCSGKTTTAERILDRLHEAGKRVLTVSIDDFYKDVSLHSETGEPILSEKLDFESVESIDLETFAAVAEKLRTGESAYLPAFDFQARRRTRYTRVDPTDYDYYLFEGIQAVYPEVLACLGDAERLSVFSSVRRSVTLDGVTFAPREIRLIRRLVRDARTRNATADFTFYLWDGVVKNEEKNILPFADSADYSIDSLLPYELHVLRDPLLRVLRALPSDSPYFEAGRKLCEKVEHILPLPASLVPASSICREFIGMENN